MMKPFLMQLKARYIGLIINRPVTVTASRQIQMITTGAGTVPGTVEQRIGAVIGKMPVFCANCRIQAGWRKS